jgi:hypothetical protein
MVVAEAMSDEKLPPEFEDAIRRAKSVIPAFTLIGPWEGDGTWTVTISDYDPSDHYDICEQLRFETKEQAEAFIAENKPRAEPQP